MTTGRRAAGGLVDLLGRAWVVGRDSPESGHASVARRFLKECPLLAPTAPLSPEP